MNRSTITTFAILSFVVAAAAFYAFLQTERGSQTVSEADISLASTAEGPKYKDLNGNPIDLSQFDGQVRVVNSWASWCPFCVNELPDFAKLFNEYKDQEVAVIAINRKEAQSTAKAFVNTLTDVEGLVFALDETDFFYSSIGGFSMPETIFYDTEGNVVVHKRGFMSLEEMRQHTETTIASSQIDNDSQ